MDYKIFSVRISTHFRKIQRKNLNRLPVRDTFIMSCGAAVSLRVSEIPGPTPDVSNGFKMNPTRYVLPAQSTKVPVDMKLAASFKMKVRCLLKTGVLKQWKI